MIGMNGTGMNGTGMNGTKTWTWACEDLSGGVSSSNCFVVPLWRAQILHKKDSYGHAYTQCEESFPP